MDKKTYEQKKAEIAARIAQVNELMHAIEEREMKKESVQKPYRELMERVMKR